MGALEVLIAGLRERKPLYLGNLSCRDLNCAWSSRHKPRLSERINEEISSPARCWKIRIRRLLRFELDKHRISLNHKSEQPIRLPPLFHASAPGKSPVSKIMTQTYSAP